MDALSALSPKTPTNIWPEKFPVGRTALAWAVVPLISNMLLFVLMQAMQATHPLPGENADALNNVLSPEHAYELLLISILFSAPGYVTFLLLGLPTLYVLYRLRVSSFILFALLGAACAFSAWVAFGFGMHSRQLATGLRYVYLWSEFKAIGPLGALDGVLTRLIVLGGRLSATPEN